MGIRYYAYPIDDSHVERALAEPRLYLSDDPLMDAWGAPDVRPQMLYLDKCWRELQGVLGSREGRPPRPSFELVEGEVTHTERGWIPFIRCIPPDRLELIAEDLLRVNELAVREALDEWPAFRRGDFDYVVHYLKQAQEFVSRLAHDGRGLVYLIG